MDDIRRRLMGSSALASLDGEITGVDIDGFVRRVLLFDRYLLVSVRLQEFPYLFAHLGFEGLRDLLAEGLLEIRCECMQLAQVGQSGIFGDQGLPPYHFKFNWVDSHDREKYLSRCLEFIGDTPGITPVDAEMVREGIAKAIRPLPRDIMSRTYPTFVADLMQPRLLEASVKIALIKRVGSANFPMRLAVHRLDEETFRIDNDIAAYARITTADAHRIVESGLMGLAGLAQTIQEMETYTALSGFRDEEMPLFREKLSFLAELASSQKTEAEFQRVIEINNLPHFSSESAKIDVERLLKVRDSSEAREFRGWLASSGDLSEREIADRVSGLRAHAGLKVSGAVGKSVRFLATSLASLVPNPILGLALGALDQFVIDKILPRAGIAAFVNELYPSIFKSTPRTSWDDLRIVNRD